MNALITGASGSIGSSIAKNLAKQGANVMISGTRLDSLRNVADDIKNETGRNPIIIQSDLSKSEELSSLVDRAIENMGRIDILVNNAGINRDTLFVRMTDSDFDDVININLKAIFKLSQLAISHMSRNKFGRIINISSVVGYTGNPGQANYCASKSAIVGMSKSIALEYARRGITINCIAPGAIKSPMIDKLSESVLENFMNKIPMQRIGEPDDVAFACCFLASRESSYITGQTIHVNGGMLMP